MLGKGHGHTIAPRAEARESAREKTLAEREKTGADELSPLTPIEGW